MSMQNRKRPWWLLTPIRIHPAWWLVVGGLLLGIDYLAGIYREFPVVYVVPVSLAAYYSGRWPALALAVAIPIAHLGFTVLGNRAADVPTVVAVMAFRGGVIILMALWLARLGDHERALSEEVRTLRGLLPICSFCKRIRNDANEWEPLEPFISKRSQTQFSHGICPPCLETHYPGFAERPAPERPA